MKKTAVLLIIFLLLAAPVFAEEQEPDHGLCLYASLDLRFLDVDQFDKDLVTRGLSEFTNPVMPFPIAGAVRDEFYFGPHALRIGGNMSWFRLQRRNGPAQVVFEQIHYGLLVGYAYHLFDRRLVLGGDLAFGVGDWSYSVIEEDFGGRMDALLFFLEPSAGLEWYFVREFGLGLKSGYFAGFSDNGELKYAGDFNTDIREDRRDPIHLDHWFVRVEIVFRAIF
jgi:hypothetical protein